MRTPGERFDFEPDLMLDDLMQKPVPDEPAPADQVAKLVTELERATRSAAAGERLFRSGVIAKVEAEQRALKVTRLKSNLAQARLLVAQAEVEQVRANGAEHSAEQIERAEAALAAARISADAAAQEWQRAELAAAELDLDRQRKLLAAGLGSKARVQRAMDRVSQLKAKEGAARPASVP